MIGPIWYVGQTTPAAMLILMVGAAGFLLSVLVHRRTIRQMGQGGRKDLSSFIGVAVQGLGISLASGPAAMIGGSVSWGVLSWRSLVVALTIGGSVGLFRWASKTMGANWAIVAQVREGHELITSGPFALVRNPIYLGMFLFLLSLAAATGHEAALPFAVPVFIIGTLMRTSREEKLLRATFGNAYDDYARRVKRFIPGLV